MIEMFWSTKSQHEFKPVNPAVCRTEHLNDNTAENQTNVNGMWVTLRPKTTTMNGSLWLKMLKLNYLLT